MMKPGVSLSNLPPSFRAIVEYLDAQGTYAMPIFEISATIINDITKQEYPLERIESLVLTQNFEESIGDVINLSSRIDRETYFILVNGYKNLKCKLVFKNHNPRTATTGDDAYNFVWTAILTNRTDSAKIESPGVLTNNDGGNSALKSLVTLNMELIHPMLLNIKYKKTCGIFRNITVDTAIKYFAAKLGVKHLSVTQPDNIRVIENLVIEPIRSLRDIYGFIQAKYGIYKKGLSVYFNGFDDDTGRLTVFPKYDYNPTGIPAIMPIEIMFIGNGMMAGMSRTFGYYTDKTPIETVVGSTIASGMKIICNSTSVATDASDVGVDTIGSMSLLMNTERTIDILRSIKIDGNHRSVPIGDKYLLDGLMENTTNNGFSINLFNPTYDVSYNNPWKVASNYASFSKEVVVGTWVNALPWTFQPGVKLTYTFCKSPGTISKVPGICTCVVYNFIKTKSTIPTINAFSCIASFTLALKKEI